MGAVHEFIPARLVMGVLSTRAERTNELFDVLKSHFGPIKEATTPVLFSFTDYYDKEMGGRPMRFFIVFEELVDPSTLSRMKHLTNDIELQFAEDGQRKINLDPGILSADNFILATTKDRSHRVPLCEGMYAEVTLMYASGQFNALPWTYADYRSDEFRLLFKRFRQDYLQQRRLEGRMERHMEAKPQQG